MTGSATMTSERFRLDYALTKYTPDNTLMVVHLGVIYEYSGETERYGHVIKAYHRSERGELKIIWDGTNNTEHNKTVYDAMWYNVTKSYLYHFILLYQRSTFYIQSEETSFGLSNTKNALQDMVIKGQSYHQVKLDVSSKSWIFCWDTMITTINTTILTVRLRVPETRV